MIEFIVAVDLRPDTKARHFVSVAQALGRGLVRPCCHARKRDRFSAHRKSQKVPDRLGLLRHVSPPFTHLFPRRANLKKTKHVGWLTEGIADYVRDFEFEPEKRLPLSPNKTYRDGYRTAATFLNWVAQTYDARLIEKLQAHFEADTYTDDLFMEITGRP